jgi:hypothetical protein
MNSTTNFCSVKMNESMKQQQLQRSFYLKKKEQEKALYDDEKFL